MEKLKSVEYKNVNGQMVASELYDDGSIREVKIIDGIVNYILTGKGEFEK